VIINDEMATRRVDEWLSAFSDAGLPCGPINDVVAVFDHPQIQPREMIMEIEHPGAGPIHLTGFPYKFSHTPAELRLPPPLLGEHTAEILEEILGYSREQVDGFKERGVI
jgi:crotonobetainyl-CoA:carnitine CoA-transferase CaiB-like acyl-CoA transferase